MLALQRYYWSTDLSDTFKVLVTFPFNIAWLRCCNGCLCFVSSLYSFPLSFLSVSFPSLLRPDTRWAMPLSQLFPLEGLPVQSFTVRFSLPQNITFLCRSQKMFMLASLNGYRNMQAQYVIISDYKISTLTGRCLN